MKFFRIGQNVQMAVAIPHFWLRKGQEGRIVGKCGDIYEVEIYRSGAPPQVIPIEPSLLNKLG